MQTADRVTELEVIVGSRVAKKRFSHLLRQTDLAAVDEIAVLVGYYDYGRRRAEWSKYSALTAMKSARALKNKQQTISDKFCIFQPNCRHSSP